MYKSGIKAKELFADIRSEADISVTIPDGTLARSLNALEQFLYSEIIDEQISVSVDYSDISDDSVEISSLGVGVMPDGADTPVFDDIVRVFADFDELEKTGASGAVEFPEKPMYYTDYSGNLRLVVQNSPDEITVVLRIRPALKTGDYSAEAAIPAEFIDMAAAKIRGDVYRISNADGQAAKWLAEYNNRLESFKVWAAKRNERFGG